MPDENTKPFPCFVVDASFMAAYLLSGFCDDEFTSCINDVEYILENNGQFYVPPLFWYEIENVLLQKTRSKKEGQLRLSKSDAMDILYDLQQLPIYTDLLPDGEIRQRIFEFAEEMFNKGLLEVASLARGEDVGIAAFRLIKDNRYLCWIVLNDDPQLPTLLHAKYIADKASQQDFIYDFGVGPYGYKLVTFKPRPAPTFSLCMAKSPWGQLMGVKDMLIRYAKDYLKPIIRKEH